MKDQTTHKECSEYKLYKKLVEDIWKQNTPIFLELEKDHKIAHFVGSIKINIKKLTDYIGELVSHCDTLEFKIKYGGVE